MKTLPFIGLALAISASAADASVFRSPILHSESSSTVRAGEGEPVLAPFEHVRFCIKAPAECTGSETRTILWNDVLREDLEAVNLSVNGSIRPERKSAARRFEAGWSIHPGSGDCNDYAVTKRSELIGRGYPAGALLLAVVKTRSGEGHLVLLVRTNRGDFVLDNLSSYIQPWTRTSYRWLERQSDADPRYWVSIRPELKHADQLLVADLRGTAIE